MTNTFGNYIETLARLPWSQRAALLDRSLIRVILAARAMPTDAGATTTVVAMLYRFPDSIDTGIS